MLSKGSESKRSEAVRRRTDTRPPPQSSCVVEKSDTPQRAGVSDAEQRAPGMDNTRARPLLRCPFLAPSCTHVVQPMCHTAKSCTSAPCPVGRNDTENLAAQCVLHFCRASRCSSTILSARARVLSMFPGDRLPGVSERPDRFALPQRAPRPRAGQQICRDGSAGATGRAGFKSQQTTPRGVLADQLECASRK